MNAALVLLSAVLVPASLNLMPLSSPGVMLMPALIDIGVGIALLVGHKGVLPWAIVRVVLGFIVFTTLQAFQEPYLAVIQIFLSSSFLLLLIGNAGALRMALGGVLFGLYALSCVVGFGATLTGKNPLAEVIQVVTGQIEREPAGVVTGFSSHYRLHTPSDRWHLFKTEVAKKRNALADRWLTRPDLDAHVLVIAEKMQGKRVMVDALADAVLANARRSATALELVGREPLRTHPQHGRLLHTRTTTKGLELEMLTGTVGVYEHGFQIIAFAPRKSYPEVEEELRSIIESFELPTDEPPGLPEDVDPAPAGRVKGLSQPYALTAPSELWHLRREAAAKKDNPLTDRWLVRPDEDAHILVIAESAPGAVVDVDLYADAIANNIETNVHGTIESREPIKTNPSFGRVLHVKATTNGLPLEYYYGVFARGEHGFQVIAFAHQEIFPLLSDDFMKVLETFEMP